MPKNAAYSHELPCYYRHTTDMFYMKKVGVTHFDWKSNTLSYVIESTTAASSSRLVDWYFVWVKV